MAEKEDLHFGKKAVALKFIDALQLASCLKEQRQRQEQGESVSLLDILLHKGHLEAAQITRIQSEVTFSSETVNLSDKTKLNAEQIAQKNFGRYKILGELGHGGMGQVFKAYDPHLDRTIALKVILAGGGDISVQRFLREAKTTAKLKHPHIVTLYDLGNENGQNFFTMDFIEGKALDILIKENTLSIKQITSIMIKVAEAVEYAHSLEIIHRDLKPANIMLEKDNTPKVMDFGLAKMTQGDSKLSQSGIILGTLLYMPPEQADGRLEEIDKRSDVYALGAILYEMLVGKVPFSGSSFSQVLDKIFREAPVPPTQINPKIPKTIAKICLKALEKDKKDRYQSAAAFASDLLRFERGEAIVFQKAKVTIHKKNRTNKTAKQVSKKTKVSQKSVNKSPLIFFVAGVFVLALIFIFSKQESLPLTIKAAIVNQNKKAQNKFFVDEKKIEVAISWQGGDASETAKVQAYGSNIRFYEKEVLDVQDKVYCPVKLTEKKSGSFDLIVRVQLGQQSKEKKLFLILEKKELKITSSKKSSSKKSSSKKTSKKSSKFALKPQVKKSEVSKESWDAFKDKDLLKLVALRKLKYILIRLYKWQKNFKHMPKLYSEVTEHIGDVEKIVSVVKKLPQLAKKKVGEQVAIELMGEKILRGKIIKANAKGFYLKSVRKTHFVKFNKLANMSVVKFFPKKLDGEKLYSFGLLFFCEANDTLAHLYFRKASQKGFQKAQTILDQFFTLKTKKGFLDIEETIFVLLNEKKAKKHFSKSPGMRKTAKKVLQRALKNTKVQKILFKYPHAETLLSFDKRDKVWEILLFDGNIEIAYVAIYKDHKIQVEDVASQINDVMSRSAQFHRFKNNLTFRENVYKVLTIAFSSHEVDEIRQRYSDKITVKVLPAPDGIAWFLEVFANKRFVTKFTVDIQEHVVIKGF